MPRLSAQVRRRIITAAAVRVAKRVGLVNVNVSTVAAECETQTSVSTVRYHFPCQADLWLAVAAADRSFVAKLNELGVQR